MPQVKNVLVPMIIQEIRYVKFSKGLILKSQCNKIHHVEASLYLLFDFKLSFSIVLVITV